MLLTYWSSAKSAIRCLAPLEIQTSHALSNSSAFSASMRPLTFNKTAFSTWVATMCMMRRELWLLILSDKNLRVRRRSTGPQPAVGACYNLVRSGWHAIF